MNGRKSDIAVVGLGVMGRNLLLNIAEHGFKTAGYDIDEKKVLALREEGKGRDILGVSSYEELIGSLKKPKVVLILVPAGKIVDDVIDKVAPKLDEKDIIIDAGNSHFEDSDRRAKKLALRNLCFIGAGISGGEKGARSGPSIMPGGEKEAYSKIKDIFEAIAAKVDGRPCVEYLGPGSAGHYVKMVHNGIEYASMQIIAEAYDILKRLAGLDNAELAVTFAKWNKTELESFLIEITSKIFRQQDDCTDAYLVDKILDSAAQKGTGKWTSQGAMDINVPVPTVDAAVGARDLSVYKNDRQEAYGMYESLEFRRGSAPDFTEPVKSALYFAMIMAYAQGFSLLRVASRKYNYNLNLADIAAIWRGGCIIRASLLDEIKKSYGKNPDLSSLLLDNHFSGILKARYDGMRDTVCTAIKAGIPVPAFSSSLAYFDSFRRKRLPANLLQAQRDFFGSHTYERTDKQGRFHTKWQSNTEET